MRALEALPHAHVAGVRATEAHRHAEALGGADGDVGAPLPRRGGQGEGEQVGGGRDERARRRARRRRGRPGRAARPSMAGYCTSTPKTSAPPAAARSSSAVVTPVRSVTTTRDAQRQRPGAHDGRGSAGRPRASTRSTASAGALLERRIRVIASAAAVRLVEQRGAGDRQPGEVADDGLEVEQRLEPALGDLRLVGRVGGVPGGVLEDVALDDGRGERAVVAEPDHRGDPAVAGGDLAQLLEHGGLGGGRLDVQAPRRRGCRPGRPCRRGRRASERPTTSSIAATSSSRGPMWRPAKAGRSVAAGCSRWLLADRRRRRPPPLSRPARRRVLQRCLTRVVLCA